MTPDDASLPYSVAAAAPFRISTRSTASQLMSSRREPSSPARPLRAWSPELSTRIPSTYTTGSFDIAMLLLPRIRIRAPDPVAPSDVRAMTDGSLA